MITWAVSSPKIVPMRVEIPTSVMYNRVRGRIALYFCMVSLKGEDLSSTFPTFVAPDAVLPAVFFLDLDLLASRDDNDAVLVFLLCVAPPLNSRTDSMLGLALLETSDFGRANGAGVWMLAETTVVETTNIEAKHSLWNFRGLIFQPRCDVCNLG